MGVGGWGTGEGMPKRMVNVELEHETVLRV